MRKTVVTIFIGALLALGVYMAVPVEAQPSGWLSFVMQDPSQAVQFRVMGAYGAPGFIGIGTAAPTAANSGLAPVNGEFYVVRDNAQANEPVATFYSAASTAWRSLPISTLATNAPQIANSVWFGANTITWEGATADAFETILQAQDADTAVHTFQLPDNNIAADTYNLMFSVLDTNALLVANSIWFDTNTMLFEGATADTFQMIVTVEDPVTADRTWTIVDFDQAASFMGSTLVTNAPTAANAITFAANAMIWEGATGGDTFQMILAAEDPVAADRTYTIPDMDANGAFMLSLLATNAPDTANSIWTAANTLIFEGATIGANEHVIQAADATADYIWEFPNHYYGADTYVIHGTRDGELTASQYLLPTLPVDAGAAAEAALAGDNQVVCYREYIPYPMTVTEAVVYEFQVAAAGADDYLGVAIYEDADAGAQLTEGASVYAADGAALVIDLADVTLYPGFYRICAAQNDVSAQDWLAIAQTATVTAIYNETVSEIRFGIATNPSAGNADMPATTGALATTAEEMPIIHLQSN